jgi:outer membrane lipase/esterase
MLKRLSQLLASARVHTTVVASIFAVCCGIANTAAAIPFSEISQLVFFGDSLTDSGYNDNWSFPTPLPVGKAPTFTTYGGYVWAQYVARDIKGVTLPIYPGPNPPDTITNNSEYPVPGFVSGTLTGGFDYAAAGSTTAASGFNETWAPALATQVLFYESTHGNTADAKAIYFIWSGANDILKVLTAPTFPTQLQLLITASSAATNIASQAAILASRGATRIVVVTLPNLGLTPLINSLAASNPTLPAQMQSLSFTFNSMMNTALGGVVSRYGVKILIVDSYDLLDNIALSVAAGQPYTIAGQSFKFVNATSPACSTVSQAIYCPSTAPTNYVFADSLHPTDMAHRVLSLQVEQQIAAWS